MKVSFDLQQLASLNAQAWNLRRLDPRQAERLATDVYQTARVRDDVRAHSLVVLAFCCVDRSEFGDASSHLQEAEECLARFEDPAGSARIATLRGVIACRKGDYDAALSYLQIAREQGRRADRADLQAQALMRLGEVYSYRSDFERSHALFRQAETLIKLHGDAFDRSELALLQSRTFRLVGNYTGALEQGRAALQAKRTLGDILGELYALNNLGLIFHDPYDSAQALTYYLDALARSEAVSDRRIRLVLLGNLGELYGELGDLDKALLYTQQSLELSKAIGSLHTLGISLEGVGILHARQGDAHKASTFYHRALAIREQIGDVQGQASALRQLANAHALMAEREQALAYFKQSLALARQIEHRYTEAEVLNDLGTFYVDSGQPKKAESYFRDALKLAQAMGLTQLVRDVAEALYRLHKAEGNAESALAHFEQVYNASLKLSDEVGLRRTQMLLAQFELERAKQETEIARLRNVELAQANALLEVNARENAELLKELKRQANEDALTSLPNRRSFSETLERSFAQAARHGQPLAVALADIDNFKAINDHFSHAVGDAVLKMVAELLQRTLREGDVSARFGGEEFALAFPETAEPQARLVCERVRVAVETYDWTSLRVGLKVTLSVGVSSDTRGGAEKMLARADARLYRAKRTGKNCVA